MSAKRRPLVFNIVVGVLASDMPDGRLGSDFDKFLIVLDVESCPGGVKDLPADDRRDLDRVADRIVDLEYVRVECSDPQRNLLALGKRIDPAKPVLAHRSDINDRTESPPAIG